MKKSTVLILAAALAGSSLWAQQQTTFRTSQDAVRYYENLVGTLSRQVQSIQDESAMTAASVSELKNRIARMEAENKAMRQEIDSLRKQIAADAEVRKSQLNNLADKLSQQPQTRPAKTAVRSTAAAVRAADSTEQEFIEHTVEPGTTLTALAKAYKVSVRDIVNANNLKKGRIYAGQKLLIPVPASKK